MQGLLWESEACDRVKTELKGQLYCLPVLIGDRLRGIEFQAILAERKDLL